MIKDLKKISDLLKIEDKKNDFDSDISNILIILEEEIKVSLVKGNIFIKKNIIKIKTISNIRFLILLKFEKINNRIKSLNKGFILEL
jgi:hypothetical protein